MKGIEIRAISADGAASLRKAFEEARQAPKLQRKAYEQLYREAILSEAPFTIRIEPRMGMPLAVMASIFESNITAMHLVKGKDFEVVVDE